MSLKKCCFAKEENNTQKTLEIGVMHLLRFTNNIFKLKIVDLFHQLLKLLTHDHFFCIIRYIVTEIEIVV